MKKLLIEGTGDLKPELSKYNFLLFFFLLSENIFPQITINGFCKYNYYEVDSGFTKFFSINFNNDAYSDFILYNPDKKEVFSITGSYQDELIDKRIYKIPSEISSIQRLNYKISSPYIFTNRKNRTVGIYEFSDRGKPGLAKSIQFDSYPEFIKTADTDKDGKNEILVSGGGFNGISLIAQDGNKLIEKELVKGNPFSQAIFIDINNDGFPDIAGYDLVKRSFIFFYNNSSGEFRETRNIYSPQKPENMQSFDVNLDSYEDLIFSSGSFINIWYGDFRSSYENTKKINTQYKPDKFIYGDFNKDGLIDFAYLNIEKSLVSVIFAKNEFDYHPEIIYMQQNGLQDIIPYYSRFINGIAALSSEGFIHTITKLSSFSDDVNISIGAWPLSISYFDNQNNGITDLCFIDEYDKKIKFVVRNNNGIPDSYFSHQLFDNHENIISENLKAGEKNYICFSFGGKLIEVIKANFMSNKIGKTILYSPGPISDLKIKRENNDNYKIYFLYTHSGSLNLGVFDYRDFKFNYSTQHIDNVNIFDASIGFDNNTIINYWTEEKEKITLFSRNLEIVKEIPDEMISFSKTEDTRIISFTNDILNMEKDISISFISQKENDNAVIAGNGFVSVIKDKKKPGKFRITSKNNLFFGETRFNGLKKLSVYLREKKIVNRFEFIEKGRNVVSTKLADTSDMGSFFIKNMTSKSYHLVYTNLEKKCITVKRLKG